MPFSRIANACKHALMLCVVVTPSAFAADILFVGNSFTFGQGTAVMHYRANTVNDLNGEGIGGVPALFKSFADQAGLDYRVALETHPGVGIDWHLDHALDKIRGGHWDTVLLQSYSTLDGSHPGDPATLVRAVKRMTQVVQANNPTVDVRLVATWSRADQTYAPNGHWYGKPIEAMANDVRTGYDLAAAATPGVKAVIPVGQAWSRAIRTGFADANPYDGIDAGKVNLWNTDHYHASVYGYYLEALTVFGSVTGRDPLSLGAGECAAADIGIAPSQALALQRIAHDELRAAGVDMTMPAAHKRLACTN